ncbi:MAG TPA: mercuric transporter MerT family protein [Acidobacteriaceae bacterium]|nr:mercuric transporter MerT family protein [Acidobacteriaceae bacterium]
MAKETNGLGVLAAGGIAAILASTCCLGPLVLVLLGFSGAWVGSLAALEPYRPWLLGFTLLALASARWRIFRPASACESGASCANPKLKRLQKVVFGLVCGLAAVAFAFPYVAPLFY